MRISLTPYLLGDGIPYFSGLASAPVKLKQVGAVVGDGVTHLHYEAVR